MSEISLIHAKQFIDFRGNQSFEIDELTESCSFRRTTLYADAYIESH